MCLKYGVCHEKVRPVTQNHLSKPDLRMSGRDVSCTASVKRNYRNLSLQILFKRPAPAIFFETAAKTLGLAHFLRGAKSIAPAKKSDA